MPYRNQESLAARGVAVDVSGIQVTSCVTRKGTTRGDASTRLDGKNETVRFSISVSVLLSGSSASSFSLLNRLLHMHKNMARHQLFLIANTNVKCCIVEQCSSNVFGTCSLNVCHTNLCATIASTVALLLTMQNLVPISSQCCSRNYDAQHLVFIYNNSVSSKQNKSPMLHYATQRRFPSTCQIVL